MEGERLPRRVPGPLVLPAPPSSLRRLNPPSTRAPAPSRTQAEWHLLSVAEVARMCGLSEKAVRRAIDDGELQAAKLRSRLRIRPEDVEEWIFGARREGFAPKARRVRPSRRSVGAFRALMNEEPSAGGAP